MLQLNYMPDLLAFEGFDDDGTSAELVESKDIRENGICIGTIVAFSRTEGSVDHETENASFWALPRNWPGIVGKHVAEAFISEDDAYEYLLENPQLPQVRDLERQRQSLLDRHAMETAAS